MSSQSTQDRTILELISRIERLELRVSGLESFQFEVVQAEVEEQWEPVPIQSGPTASGDLSTGPISETVVQGEALPSEVDAERLAILNSIGRWVARALQNNITGSSGRDQLPEPSQHYLVFRGVNGVVYNPVKVFATFPEACRLVKSRGGAFGRSVFIGVPSKSDGKTVCSSAGVAWPSD